MYNPFEQLERLGLSANFTPRERRYFDKLRDELEAIAGGVSIEELTKPSDAAQAGRILAKLEEIWKFVQDRRIETDVVLRELFFDWVHEFHQEDILTDGWVDQNIQFHNNEIIFINEFNLLSDEVTYLPDNIHCEQDLILSNSELHELPENLRVDGALSLQYSLNLERLSSGLRVGKSLNLLGCQHLASLADGLYVGESLNLDGCSSLQRLPDDLHVGLDMSLKYCSALKYLPRDLTVGGSLNLQGCTSLSILNEGLHVGGDLNLGFVIATDLPKDFFVAGDVSAYSVSSKLLDNLHKAKEQGKILGTVSP